MKKFIILLLCFLLVGCSKEDNTENVAEPLNIITSLTSGDLSDIFNNSNVIQSMFTYDEFFEIYSSTCPISDVEKISQTILKDRTTVLELGDGEISCKARYMVENNKVTSFNIYPTSYYKELANSNKFYEEEIVINKYLGIKGVISIPEKNYENVVAILVQGSGQSDYNEQIGPNRPFEDIAYGLAERGISVIRYDKRYYANPELADNETITVEDEILEDVNLAIEYAVNEGYTTVVVIGHSLGGMLTFRIAYENENVDAIVSLAGSPRGLEDIIVDQSIAYMELTGEDETTIQITELNLQAQAELVKNLDDTKEGSIFNLGVNYWRSLNKSKAELFVEHLEIPILIMQGEDDIQVLADKDYVAFEDLLVNYPSATFKLYPKLNHLFMPSKTKLYDDYEIESNVSKSVITDLATWIFNLN